MMRDKKRYVLIRFSHAQNCETEQFKRDFMAEMMRVMGQVDYALSNLRIIKLSNEEMVVRVNLAALEKFIMATALVRHISGIEIGLLTVRNSGSIAGLSKKAA
jgi:RNase P/RNase MRP subunit POP5